LKTSDFDYDLPSQFIAQKPVVPRDASKMMVIFRKSGNIEHAHFRDLGEYLNRGDLLVLNETRVILGRLYARKIPTGGKVEILLLHPHNKLTWEVIVGGSRLDIGRRVRIEGGPEAEIVGAMEGPRRMIRFDEPIELFLENVGNTPLPPYIHEPILDPDDYQTVYARVSGSAAAPTAGLHFTKDLFQKLKAKGIGSTKIVLHIGLDTFAPVTEDDPRRHKIHTEWLQISSSSAKIINQTRKRGSRIIAVGTTSVRALESSHRHAEPPRIVAEHQGSTDLYILPGYQFKVVDAMITNFHLPRSSLIMLVSAFADRERLLRIYEIAKANGYRFYSFGDAMLIL